MSDNLKTTIGELIALRGGLAKVSGELAVLKLNTSGPEFGELHGRELACRELGMTIDHALSGLSQRTRLAVLPFAKTISTREAT
jgi:hypothetical protein